jgi:hypothetical protein
MIRQRVHLHRFAITDVVMRLLVTAFGAAIAYYGAILVLGACKVSPDTLNDVSAYRTVYDQLASITAADITGRDRLIVAAAGVVCFLVLAPLAWRALPRPFLARTTDDLDDGSAPGRTEVAPRAFERVAELAAAEQPSVVHAAARYGVDAVDVRVELTSGLEFTHTLREVQDRVRAAVAAHGLPDRLVDVTLAGVASNSKGDPS